MHSSPPQVFAGTAALLISASSQSSAAPEIESLLARLTSTSPPWRALAFVPEKRRVPSTRGGVLCCPSAIAALSPLSNRGEPANTLPSPSEPPPPSPHSQEPPPPTPLTPRTPHESVTLHCQSPFSSHALAGHRLRCASSNSSLDSSTPLLLLLEGRPAEMRALTQAYFSAGTVRPAALLHRSKRGPEIERLHNLLRSHFFTRPASDHQLLSPPIPGWEEWRAEDLPGVLKLPVSVVIPSYARPHNLLALLPRLLPLEPLRSDPTSRPAPSPRSAPLLSPPAPSPQPSVVCTLRPSMRTSSTLQYSAQPSNIHTC